MKNKVFMRKSYGEKRQYLYDVLKHAGHGELDNGVIRRILPKVSIQKQYTISVFSDYQAFKNAVKLAQNGKVFTSTVNSHIGRGAAAVITPTVFVDSDRNMRAIYIYAPKRTAQKGMQYGQKLQRPHSV